MSDVCKSTKRIVMAKKVAAEWLSKRATEEYRLRIYPSFDSRTNLPSWLRGFREGRSRLGSLLPFDFAVDSQVDSVVIRTRDYQSLKNLNSYLESIGYETTGVW